MHFLLNAAKLQDCCNVACDVTPSLRITIRSSQHAVIHWLKVLITMQLVILEACFAVLAATGSTCSNTIALLEQNTYESTQPQAKQSGSVPVLLHIKHTRNKRGDGVQRMFLLLIFQMPAFQTATNGYTNANKMVCLQNRKTAENFLWMHCEYVK